MLFIGIPVLGSIDTDLAAFLLEAQGRGCKVQFFKNYKPVPLAQNAVVDGFLAHDHDRLLMIDSDMIPPANIWNLMKVDGDIVGGLYPRGRIVVVDGRPRIRFCAFKYDNELDVDSFDESFFPEIDSGVLEVSAVGTGCMLIKREVLEDELMQLGRRWVHMDGSEREDVGDFKPFFRNTYSSCSRYKGGNDVDFCLRAKRLGYSVMLDTGVVLGHRKASDLMWQVKFSEFSRGRLPAEAFGNGDDVRIL